MITCKECIYSKQKNPCLSCENYSNATLPDDSIDALVYTITNESLVKLKDKYKKTDNVNRPAHYAIRKFETIDVIKDCIKANKLDGIQGYLYGNVIKYLSRFNCKGNAIEDLKKAQYYLNRLIEVREDEKLHG